MGYQYTIPVGTPDLSLYAKKGAMDEADKQEQVSLQKNAQALSLRQIIAQENASKKANEIANKKIALEQKTADLQARSQQLNDLLTSKQIEGYETPTQKRAAETKSAKGLLGYESELRREEAQTGVDIYGKKKDIDVAAEVRTQIGMDATERSQAEIDNIRSQTVARDIDSHLASLRAVYAPEQYATAQAIADQELSNLKYKSSESRRKIEDDILAAEIDRALLQNTKLREEMFFSGDIRELDLETKREVLRQLKAKGAMTPAQELEMKIKTYEAQKEIDLKYTLDKTIALSKLSLLGVGGSDAVKKQKEIELLQKKIDSYGSLTQNQKANLYSDYFRFRNDAENLLASRDKYDKIAGQAMLDNANSFATVIAHLQSTQSGSGAESSNYKSVDSYTDEELEEIFNEAQKQGRVDIGALVKIEAKRRLNK